MMRSHLPWVQVEKDFIQYQAPAIAAELGVDEDLIIGKGVRLWAWCQGYAIDGVVRHKAAARLIAAGSRWQGDPEEFVAAFVNAKCFEIIDGGYRVRGMKRYEAELRRRYEEADRMAVYRATGKWPARKKVSKGSTGITPNSCSTDGTHYVDVAESESESNTDHDQILVEQTKLPIEGSDAVQDVFQHWQLKRNRTRSRLDEKRREKIAARLAEGFKPAELKQAVDGVRFSAWHEGENPERKVYDDIKTIFRDAEQVEKFMLLSEQHARAGPAKRAPDLPNDGWGPLEPPPDTPKLQAISGGRG